MKAKTTITTTINENTMKTLKYNIHDTITMDAITITMLRYNIQYTITMDIITMIFKAITITMIYNNNNKLYNNYNKDIQ
jgi:hypothetical protein